MEHARWLPRSTMGRALLAVLGIVLLLECWRPYFFLTDDNLDGGLPYFVELGRHLLAGQSPYFSDHLFGGGYDYRRDPTFFLWHPVYLLGSLLAGTPFRYAIIDVDATLFLLLAAAGFVRLAEHLRRELALDLGDGWILFYTLSFTFSTMALAVGASWLNFLGVHSALPWLALGILQTDLRRGSGLCALGVLSLVLGGHPTVIVSSTLMLTLFALGISVWRRSGWPLLGWLVGYGAALVIMLPLLVPMVGGFLHSARSQGLLLLDMQSYNIPGSLFLTSLFFGSALWFIHPPTVVYALYLNALGSCAAAWCALPAVTGRSRWNGPQLTTLALLFLLFVLIWRPLWISQVMMHLPLLRSLRWPFREMIEFQFFFHLLLVLRPGGFTSASRRVLASCSTALWLLPLVFYVIPPTFNTMTWDRKILLSGAFDTYWARVRPLLRPGDRVAVILPELPLPDDRYNTPYSLISAYNYAVLGDTISVWGWSQTPPADQLYVHTEPFHPFGPFQPYQRAALLAERPRLRILTLEQLHPLKITLSSPDGGPPIDLTPLIPQEGREGGAKVEGRR